MAQDEDVGSPPCFMHELDAGGRPRGDPQQARDVARWRKAERARLIAHRRALSAELRYAQTSTIARHLDALIPFTSQTILSVYWPLQGEPDLRSWMRAKAERGVRVALPVAVALGQPLTFREWRSGAPMARGLWNIPYPAEGAEVVPNVVVAPVVGFDSACYRLGYGGGFFDRTLARVADKPLVIGVGYAEALVETIFPQPHDVPMHWIVTGGSAPLRRDHAPSTVLSPT